MIPGVIASSTSAIPTPTVVGQGALSGDGQATSITFTNATDWESSFTPEEGDLMVAAVCLQAAPAAHSVSASGWSVIIEVEVDGPTGYRDHLTILTKVATDSEPASYTWNWTGSTFRSVRLLAARSSTGAGTWTLDKAAETDPSGSGTSLTFASSGALANPNELVFGMVWAFNVSPISDGFEANDGFTVMTPDVYYSHGAYKVVTSAAALAPTFSWDNSRTRAGALCSWYLA